MTQWMSIKDKLPEHEQFFLGISSKGNMQVLRCDIHRSGSHDIDYVFLTPELTMQVIGITHWMPLPMPPED